MELSDLKHFFIGDPFPSSRESHERLDKIRGLAIFASDTISSNAYATEAIMTVLIVLGSGALVATLPIALAVAGLVVLVAVSYVQTILHYPEGGGSYTVAKDNLGELPALLAAAALLVDYIMTVSVSTAAGVRAVTSAFPEAYPYRVIIALVAVSLIAWMNLRGVRESGAIFAIPTYGFVVGVFLMLVIGMARYFGLFGLPPLPVNTQTVPPMVNLAGFAFIWLILRAFSGGCTALTGIEAISNGVKAFKKPESRNAATVMIAMAMIAIVLLIGIAYLSTKIDLIPEASESILSQLTRAVTGSGFLYFWVQIFTAGILFMAANTGFQDFPRLSFFLARDNYLPRWFQNRGDRLVFSSGIAALTLLSALMLILFQADEIKMLPLYALGVMMAFSLSQSGMFRLMGRIAHLKPGETIKTHVTTIHYEKGVRWKRVINAVGAVVTFLVFLVFLFTKFLEGAWIIVILIPLVVYFFYTVNKHYERVSNALSTHDLDPKKFSDVADVAIVPIADIHRGSLLALEYAKKISNDVRVLSIVTDETSREHIMDRWDRFSDCTSCTKLELIEYDYRDVLTPIVNYIIHVNTVEFPHKLITVVIPEFIPERWIARFFHNQTASQLRWRLRQFKDIVIIEVPFKIDMDIKNGERNGG
jgi:amino acid transporter